MSHGEERFGVGSFHFAWKPAGEATNVEYSKALTEALNTISSVSNVLVNNEEERGKKYDRDPFPPSWEDGAGFYPPLEYFRVSFRVYIPTRVQNELLPRPWEDAGSETFDVLLQYGYENPVTFVHPIDPKGDAAPSIAVMLLREYLRREFKTPRQGIVLECLGPSPLHADFFLNKGGVGLSTEVPFIGSVQVADGYDTVRILYDANIIRPEDALEQCWFELTPQLSDCYEIAASYVRAVHDWDALEGIIDRLVDRDATTRWERFIRAVTRGRELARVHQALAEFEAANVQTTALIERGRRHRGRTKQHIDLGPMLDEAADDREVFPVAQVEKLVGHVEAGRFHRLDLLIALVAAIVGGIVGAVITALLSK